MADSSSPIAAVIAPQGKPGSNMPKMTRLLQSLCTDSTDQVFISPLNIEHALLLYSHGVLNQDVAQKFQESLGYSPDQVQSVFAKKLTTLQQCTNDKEKVFTAASLWFQDPELPKKDPSVQRYIDFVSQPYQAEIMPQLSVAALNQWVSTKTHKLIPKIVEELSPDVKLILASALYFYAPWEIPFCEELTSPDQFTTAQGKSQLVPMMQHEESQGFRHFVNNALGYQSLVVPYGDPDGSAATSFDAMIVLPNQVLSNGEQWTSILQDITANPEQFRQRHRGEDVQLYLPKFKVTYQASILSPLINLEDSPAGPNLYTVPMLQPGWSLSEVIHKVVVDVNERGTEAAAVTLMECEEGCCMNESEPVEFRVKRPFFFGIYARQCQEFLFAGIVNKIPESQ